MIARIAIFTLLVSLVSACDADDLLSLSAPETRTPALGELQPFPGSRHDRGKWVREGGVIWCDGYLTSVKSDRYCSEYPQPGGVQFDFDGKSYVMQPLAIAEGP